MIEREMNDLALLWTQEAVPEGEERLVQELARTVGWRGRVIRYADYAAALAIGGAVALIVLLKGTGTTAASGLMIVLVLAWLTAKRQALWELERTMDGAGREALLANAARITSARLKRTNLSLAAIVPAFVIAMWFGYGMANPELDTVQEMVAVVIRRAERTALQFAFLAALVGYLVHARAALRRELRNIEDLGLAYREEASFERDLGLPR